MRRAVTSKDSTESEESTRQTAQQPRHNQHPQYRVLLQNFTNGAKSRTMVGCVSSSSTVESHRSRLIRKPSRAKDPHMRLLSLFTAVIVLSGAGCNKSSTAETSSSTESGDSETTASTSGEADSPSIDHAAPAKSAAATGASPAARKSPPYRLLGILDPERDRMVAFALKVPADWRAQQEFHRKWEGAVGLPQIAITLNAPDGRSQIVYFPSTQYLYGDGPMSNNLRAQKRSMYHLEQH